MHYYFWPAVQNIFVGVCQENFEGLQDCGLIHAKLGAKEAVVSAEADSNPATEDTNCDLIEVRYKWSLENIGWTDLLNARRAQLACLRLPKYFEQT